MAKMQLLLPQPDNILHLGIKIYKKYQYIYTDINNRYKKVLSHNSTITLFSTGIIEQVIGNLITMNNICKLLKMARRHFQRCSNGASDIGLVYQSLCAYTSVVCCSTTTASKEQRRRLQEQKLIQFPVYL